jgi:glycine dehydrogenase subunit 1
MMNDIGIENVEDIYKESVPKKLITNNVDIENHLSEMEIEKRFKGMAKKNLSSETTDLFLGAGAYNHHIPAAVDAIIQRSEFLTSYTPYQPEISQGTLQVIFEFQSMIAAIMGMEISNASMYDGSTSLAEAALMSIRLKRKRNKIAILGSMHPAYTQVTKTQCKNQKIDVNNYSELESIQ